MAPLEYISIKGARTHNLKNIDIDIPLGKLTCITGVSGSGKSSLAMDTLYAEGERRYVESLSSYARQFLEKLSKPDVDSIQNLPAAIALEHKNLIKTSRSTVATSTEIHDYLRLLFSKIGKINCTSCGKRVNKDSPSDVAEFITERLEDIVLICFPIDISPSINPEDYWLNLISSGFIRIWLNNKIYDLTTQAQKDLTGIKKMYVIVDRIITTSNEKSSLKQRSSRSVETAYRFGNGKCSVIIKDQIFPFSDSMHCALCNIGYEEPRPTLFSFNHLFGACPKCRGFGNIIEIDDTIVIPDKSKSIQQGAIEPWNSPVYSYFLEELKKYSVKYRLPLDVPYSGLSDENIRVIWEGTEDFTGIKPFFEWVESKKYKTQMRVFHSRYRKYTTCPTCKGKRIRKEALMVQIGDKNISDICQMSVPDAIKFFEYLELTREETDISKILLQEIRRRLQFLIDIGLEYLTLDRQSKTLSGGEAQRIGLAGALGSSLSDTLYVLDEPTIGLHPRDTHRLLLCMDNLCKTGNTIVMVEHDKDCILHSDRIIDLGPGAGLLGGSVVYQGGISGISSTDSLTGKYLTGEKSIDLKMEKRKPSSGWLIIKGAEENNLKNIDVRIPLGVFTSITGVSGSGKSTLVEYCLYRNLAKIKGKQIKEPGRIRSIEGFEEIYDVRFVDQSPISRTPRSTPVTYLKAFDGIRKIFAESRDAKNRGLKQTHFSFNSSDGRCEKCKGTGFERIDMVFLADILIPCNFCSGTRYKQEILRVKFKGKSISDVLDMTALEAIDFFAQYGDVLSPLRVLMDIGMSYIKIGQEITGLSSGEAQRLKLAKELSSLEKTGILYIFDEPTTGLHFADIQKLLVVLNKLVEQGNTVVVIEHNPDVIACSDWVIDLGPEGSTEGGRIVAEGPPEKIAECKQSYTGKYIRKDSR